MDVPCSESKSNLLKTHCFSPSIVSRHLPGLNLVSGNLSGRPRQANPRICRGMANDDVALLVNYTGAAAIAAGEREVVLRGRDAVLIRSDEVITFRPVCFRPIFSRSGFPRSILSPLVSDIDEVFHASHHPKKRTPLSF